MMTPFTFGQHIKWAEKTIQDTEGELTQYQGDPNNAVALKKQLQATADFLREMRTLLDSLNPNKKPPKGTQEQMKKAVEVLKKYLRGIETAKPWQARRDYYIFECSISPNEQFTTHSPDPASLPSDVVQEGGRWFLADACDRDFYDAHLAAEIDSDIKKKGYHPSFST